MCNTGHCAILSNTEIFVCNTEANMIQYQEISMQEPNKMFCITKLLVYTTFKGENVSQPFIELLSLKLNRIYSGVVNMENYDIMNEL